MKAARQTLTTFRHMARFMVGGKIEPGHKPFDDSAILYPKDGFTEADIARLATLAGQYRYQHMVQWARWSAIRTRAGAFTLLPATLVLAGTLGRFGPWHIRAASTAIAALALLAAWTARFGNYAFTGCQAEQLAKGSTLEPTVAESALMGKTVHDTNAAIVATGDDYTTAVRLFWVAMVLAWAGIAWEGLAG